MKIIYAIINTLLSGGAIFLLVIDLAFSFVGRFPLIEVVVYIPVIILLLVSIVASWIFAFKDSKNASKILKILTYASLPVFVFFILIFGWSLLGT